MASSDLITSIDSALKNLDLIRSGGGSVYSSTVLAGLQLMIELRNLKVQLVIGFRKLGDDLPSRFSGIEAAVARILLRKISVGSWDEKCAFEKWIYGDALSEIRGLAKQVADECLTSPLALDDVVAIADSILDNVVDFVAVLHKFQSGGLALEFAKVEVIDAFVAQVTFLKCLLVFADATGVELQHLMVRFQPFAINVSRIFIKDEDSGDVGHWYEEVRGKCSMVIGIATSAHVCEAYTQALGASTFSSSQSSAAAGILDDFLGSLISLLWDMLRHHLNSRVKDQLKLLYERIRFCRSILKRKLGGLFDGEMRDRVRVLICGAGMLVCSLHHTHVELSYPDRLSELLDRFDLLQVQLIGHNPLMLRSPINDEMSSDASSYTITNDANEETVTSSYQPRVVGFQDDEVNPVLDRLMRGSKHMQIVPICGMAGVGKTTFALNLYNHRSIIHHFHSRAWCPISQVPDKKRVMLKLLSQLIPGSESYTWMTEDDLANKLRQSLKGKRYLIVLDDIWTSEVWLSLAPSIPDDSTQSRVILTSRHRNIVSNDLPDQQPHLLRLRKNSECLEILENKLSHKEGWSFELGMTIAKMCKGLPLTVVIVAGLLGITKPQGWKGILDHLSSSGISSEEQCNGAMELSFKHLSDDLKLCFLYLAAFPEDEEIYVKRLIRLWIGEGFARGSHESKRIEDVGREYMENLIQRSLVMVARNRSIGGVRSIRIHDLLRDFCLRKAKKENFFHVLSQRDDELSNFNEPPNLQRLSIHSDPVHFKKAMLFCPRAHSMLLIPPYAHSYLFDMAFIVQIFKHLTVLELGNIFFISGIPSEIEILTQLRYLSICSNLPDIPSSLGNLLNLETLIGSFRGMIPFPHTFWNLCNLKWLDIECSYGFTLPTENLENACALQELDTLCGIVFSSYSSMEEQLRKFPNIRRLKCIIQLDEESATNSSNIVIPEYPNQLQCLSLRGKGALGFGFSSMEHLRRLSLASFILSRENISDIGKLPNLEVFKLESGGFWCNTLEMKDGEFLKLRYFKLAVFAIKRWIVLDELPCLQTLVLKNCKVLEELPCDCLKDSATLEEIQVLECSLNVDDFAREIQRAQEDYGNLVEVHIRSSKPLIYSGAI